MEKLRLIKRNLMQVNRNTPIHLELGSIGDADHVAEVLNRVRGFFISFSVSDETAYEL